MEQDYTPTPNSVIPEVSENETEVSKNEEVVNLESVETEESVESEQQEQPIIVKEFPAISFEALSCEDILLNFKKLMDEFSVMDIKTVVEQLPNIFENRYQQEYKDAFDSFKATGDEGEFQYDQSKKERFNNLYKQYRDKKNEIGKQIETEREKNLQLKLQLIEDLKGLVKKEESLNKTFQEFRDIQERWRNIGYVPQANVNDLQESYHLHTENFYNYIKINKELRDLDLKKNLDAKIALCELAEKLKDEANIHEAFKNLQDLHNQWREVGPIPKEQKDVLWDRFKAATTTLNEKYHEYCENLKKDLEVNLTQKIDLCTKAEGFANGEYKSASDWNKATQKLLELQEQWKGVGAIPYKERNKVFKQFRAACNVFFDKKRDFYKTMLLEQEQNLKLKTELCEKVEAIKDSSDWKAVTDKIIFYQKEWKKIGPAPQRHSNKIWLRFRAGCDEFFNRKNTFFKNIDSEQVKNLELKKALIEEIRNFTLAENNQTNIDALKSYQERWAAIGFVPIKEKDAIQEEYRKLIDARFDSLNMDEFDKNLEKFKVKIQSLGGDENNDHKIVGEREKLVVKIRQLENDIHTWENNIGFFAKSKNADSLLVELQHKIESTKQRLDLLTAKLKALDNML